MKIEVTTSDLESALAAGDNPPQFGAIRRAWVRAGFNGGVTICGTGIFEEGFGEIIIRFNGPAREFAWSGSFWWSDDFGGYRDARLKDMWGFMGDGFEFEIADV